MVGDRTLHEGDLIAIDGSSGVATTDDVPLVEPEVDSNFEKVLGWADEIRRLGVRANADTPADATKSREFGAEGIGLCRTEHMFMAADRQPRMQAMIMASEDSERRRALGELLPLQQSDFEQLFEVMSGFPVTIRLLDPPFHEFLPAVEDLVQQIERGRANGEDNIEDLEKTLDQVRELVEINPMLGTRGVRLGILHSEIYEMQVRAIVRAALAVEGRSGEGPDLEIMIPLVAYEKELQLARDLVERVLGEEGGDRLPLKVGTMIELPRACIVADRIGLVADFFSFGTNDLTQTTIGLSRDDIEGKFLAKYIERDIVDRSPFETLDSPGVGWLVRLAARTGREANANLGLGICGEHGGDPESIAFFDAAHLDYVSCSPFRVPIARVAAAQSAIGLRKEGAK